MFFTVPSPDASASSLTPRPARQRCHRPARWPSQDQTSALPSRHCKQDGGDVPLRTGALCPPRCCKCHALLSLLETFFTTFWAYLTSFVTLHSSCYCTLEQTSLRLFGADRDEVEMRERLTPCEFLVDPVRPGKLSSSGPLLSKKAHQSFFLNWHIFQRLIFPENIFFPKHCSFQAFSSIPGMKWRLQGLRFPF